MMDPEIKGRSGFVDVERYDGDASEYRSELDSENYAELLLDEKNVSRTQLTQPLLTQRTNTFSQIAIVGANLSPIESLDYE